MDNFDVKKAELSKIINIQITYSSYIHLSPVRTEDPCLNVVGLFIYGLCVTLHENSKIGFFEYIFVSALSS